MEEINDKFLVDFFEKLSDEEVLLLREAVASNFAENFVNNVKVSKDWKNSLGIYQDCLKLITEKLYDVSSPTGFPKGQQFVKTYMRSFIKKTEEINNADIIQEYIKRRIAK